MDAQHRSAYLRSKRSDLAVAQRKVARGGPQPEAAGALGADNLGQAAGAEDGHRVGRPRCAEVEARTNLPCKVGKSERLETSTDTVANATHLHDRRVSSGAESADLGSQLGLVRLANQPAFRQSA